MAKEFKLSMVISARDDASKAITKAMRDSTKASQNAEKAQEKLGKRQRTTAEEGIRQNRALSEAYKRQNRARETLGIRAERAIQREIQQTIAAYNRLSRSGTLSIDEQSRAYERMRQRVSQLRVEMQGMNRLARVSDIAGSIAKAGGALVAGGMAVAPPVKKQMSYSRTLADMSNVAFNDRDIQGRTEGKKELDIIIQDSIAKGGGTKEEAANLLGGLLAKGVFEFEEIKELMPLLQQYSTATGVGGEELAKVTESLKEYGITSADEMMKVMDAAIRSGQEGSFEFSDMAKWLPEILSKAKAIGYSGSEDIVKLLAYSQGMMKNAPTADTAGNNFVNLLNKVSSQELATKAKAIKVDGYGIDMAGTLTQAQAKGIDPISALVGLTDVIARQNPEFRKIEAQLSKTDKNSPEYQKLLESQRRILESSAIGQLIADQQALMGLLAAREYRGYIKQVENESKKQLYLPKGEGEGYVSYGLIAQENDFKVQQAKEQSDFAQMGAVKPLSDSLGNLADKFTDFSKEFPGLTTAVMGAKTGIEAMTQAAIAFAALKFLLSGSGGLFNRAPRTIPNVPPATTTSPLSGAKNAFSKILPKGLGSKILPIISTGIMAYEGAQDFPLIQLQTKEEKLNDYQQRFGRELNEQEKALFGTPGFKDALDDVLKWLHPTKDEHNSSPSQRSPALPPYLTGRNSSPLFAVPDYGRPITSSDAQKVAYQPSVKPNTHHALPSIQTPQHIELRTTVELDGHVLAEAVNKINGQDANRSTGGFY